MPNEPVIPLLIAATIVVVMLLMRPKKAARQSNNKTKYLARLRSSGNYWGATIRNGKCPAAKRMAGRGFRLAEAPSLPIPGCRSLRCSCNYAGLRERRVQERRSNTDRRSESRLGSAQAERRGRRDRRCSFK
jgi:hypothetical protein